MLGLPLDQAAYLQAAVAVGVVVGAAAAGRWVPLARRRHMLGAGVVLGLLLPVLALSADLSLAVPLLCSVGAGGRPAGGAAERAAAAPRLHAA